MDLPNAAHREKYVELVRELEGELKEATSNDSESHLSLRVIQKKLDTVANKYQNDDKIGSARYKLYELQAFVHYFDHEDEKALDFINHAVRLRGSTYQKAEKLKEALLSKQGANGTTEHIDESKMTRAEKRKKLIGLEGWLAWFIVGQFLSLFITTYGFFASGFLSTSEIATINQYQSGLGDTLQTLTAFENIAILVSVALSVTTLVLLFRRRKLAKPFAIALLVFTAVYGIIDYTIASSLVNSSAIFQTASIQTFMSKYSGDVGRDLLVAFVWVPYFLVSKRVKSTLAKD